jgi:hypothetical protein
MAEIRGVPVTRGDVLFLEDAPKEDKLRLTMASGISRGWISVRTVQGFTVIISKDEFDCFTVAGHIERLGELAGFIADFKGGREIEQEETGQLKLAI